NRQRRAEVAGQAAALTDGSGRTQPEAAHDHVGAERTVIDGQGAALVEDAAALGDAAWSAEGLILGHDHMAEAQVTAGVPDAGAVVGPAVRDRQVVDLDGDAAGDPEDPAGVIAADGQPIGPQAVDVQALVNHQFPAG